MAEAPSTVESVRASITNLVGMLETQNPGFGQQLRVIHKALQDDPECATLLSEEEIAVISMGLERQTSIIISTAGAKKQSTRAKVKNLSDDEF